MPSKKFLNPRNKAYLFLMTSACLWGAGGPIIKFTLQGLPPLPFLAYRFLIAGFVGLLILMFTKINIPKNTKILQISFIYAFLVSSVALSFLFLGLESSTVLDLALIGNSVPILIMLGGWLIYKDRITKREIKGTMITLFGTAIVILGPLYFAGNIPRLTGNLFLLSFLIIDSISVLISKHLVKNKVNPLFLANLAFVVGALTLIPFVISYYGITEISQMILSLDLSHHLGVWYMSIFAGIVAYASLARGVRTIEVSEAGLFAYLQPLVATPLAVLWLGESITVIFIMGALIISLGLYLAETKP